MGRGQRSISEGGRAACCGLWQALHATSKQVLSAQFSSSFAHRVDNSVSFARRLAFLRKAQPYQDTPLARCKSCVSKRLLCETPALFEKGATLSRHPSGMLQIVCLEKAPLRDTWPFEERHNLIKT